jgi:hypothetical protein
MGEGGGITTVGLARHVGSPSKGRNRVGPLRPAEAACEASARGRAADQRVVANWASDRAVGAGDVPGRGRLRPRTRRAPRPESGSGRLAACDRPIAPRTDSAARCARGPRAQPPLGPWSEVHGGERRHPANCAGVVGRWSLRWGRMSSMESAWRRRLCRGRLPSQTAKPAKRPTSCASSFPSALQPYASRTGRPGKVGRVHGPSEPDDTSLRYQCGTELLLRSKI